MAPNLRRCGRLHKRDGLYDLGQDAADGHPGHHDHLGGRLASEHQGQIALVVGRKQGGRLSSEHQGQIVLGVRRVQGGRLALEHQGQIALVVHRKQDGRRASERQGQVALVVHREQDGRRGGRLELVYQPIPDPCEERVDARHGHHHFPCEDRAAGEEENLVGRRGDRNVQAGRQTGHHQQAGAAAVAHHCRTDEADVGHQPIANRAYPVCVEACHGMPRELQGANQQVDGRADVGMDWCIRPRSERQGAVEWQGTVVP